MSESGCRDLSNSGVDGLLAVEILWTIKTSIVLIEPKIMCVLVSIGERELFAEDISSQSSKVESSNTNNCTDLHSANEPVLS